MTIPTHHLGLFAKFWQPGKVKTRLAASIGNQEACRIYQAFVQHLLSRLDRTGDNRFVVFTPTSSRTEFEHAIPGNWNLTPQVDGDLGMRMKGFFGARFEDTSTSANRTKVIVIGADSPHLTAADIESAFIALDKSNVVIGPSNDGGYYLLGMTRVIPELFEGIDWSTETVFSETISRLKTLDEPFHVLPEKIDVDDISDLRALEQHLNSQSAPNSQATELLELIRPVIKNHDAPNGETST